MNFCLLKKNFFLFLEPPVFVRKPSPVEVLKGVDVSFECELLGTPPFEVAWFKDRRQIRSSKKFKLTSKDTLASIHVLNVEPADIGEYQCRAVNEVGSDNCVCAIKFKGTVYSYFVKSVFSLPS